AVETAIANTRDTGATPIFLCDAENDEDLKLIAALMEKYGSRLLWCGSSGLAEYLPVGPASPPPVVIGTSKPILVVAGSRSSLTSVQLTAAAQHDNTARIELDSRKVSSGGSACEAEEERCSRSAASALD